MRIWRIAQDFDLAERVTREVYRLQRLRKLPGRHLDFSRLTRAKARIQGMILSGIPFMWRGYAEVLTEEIIGKTYEMPMALDYIRGVLAKAWDESVEKSGVMDELMGGE